MTVADLMERISHREFVGWIEYYELEPFGDLREDWRMGQIASTIANVAPRSKKSVKLLTPADFMWKPPSRKRTKQTVREQLDIAKSINSLMGGKEIKESVP